MANSRESPEFPDSGKKVRIKRKSDPIKQDPRLVLAHGKSALKKDDGNITSTSLTSYTSQQLDSPLSSDVFEKRSSKQNSPEEGKPPELDQNGEKEEQLNIKTLNDSENKEKLAKKKENSEINAEVPISNIKETANKEIPTDRVQRETSPIKFNVKDDHGGPRGHESKSLQPELPSPALKQNDILAKDRSPNPDSDVEQGSSVSKEATSQGSISTEALKQNEILSNSKSTKPAADAEQGGSFSKTATSQDSVSTEALKQNDTLANSKFPKTDVDVEQGGSLTKDATSQDSVSTEALKQNDILANSKFPKTDVDVEQGGSFSKDATSQENVNNERSNETAKRSEQGKRNISNDQESVVKEDKISEPLSSIEEDLVTVNQTSKTAEGEKPSDENGKLMMGDANKDMSSSSLITEQIRQSMEKLQLKDDQANRVSTSNYYDNFGLDEMKKTSNENETSYQTTKATDDGNDGKLKDDSNNVANEGKSPGVIEINSNRASAANDDNARDLEPVLENENAEKFQNYEVTEKQMRLDESDDADANPAVSAASVSTLKKHSDSNDTTDAGSFMVKPPDTVEMTDRSSNIDEEGTTAKEIPLQGGKSPTQTQDYYDGKNHRDENSTEELGISGKDDPDERKDGNDDGLPISLERTAGSEDLKITELKNRVRPGQVFVVKGDADADCYTVKWADKRKVLAYKVGSKNTSRFSTLLIETVEKLEKASVRHPSIISEFIHSTDAKGSLLSTYFAGANARQSIKDNFVREAGTNTDHKDEVDARQTSPEYNFSARDHLSPEQEAFGGAVPKQPTTGTPMIQSNNYNYPS